MTLISLEYRLIICIALTSKKQFPGEVVSTPDAIASSIPAFSTCLFHVVPRVVPGSAADEKTGPVVLTVQTNKSGTNCVHLFIYLGMSAIIG